jgi:hypothetical protein
VAELKRAKRADRHREPRTLLEVIYVRTGSLRATYRVGELIQQWAICRRDLGRRPEVAEYADWWKMGERTAYRQLADFRKAFADEDGPDRIAVLLLARGDELVENAARVLSLPPDLAHA